MIMASREKIVVIDKKDGTKVIEIEDKLDDYIIYKNYIYIEGNNNNYYYNTNTFELIYKMEK